jgi:adenosylcobinamide-phosphate synthase
MQHLIPILLYPVATLLIALLIDGVLGDPPNPLHPVAWMGGFIAGIWRIHPAVGANRAAQFIFGTVLVLTGLAVFCLPWIFLLGFSLPLFWVWSAPALKAAFAMRSLLKAAGEVASALQTGDMQAARTLVHRHLVSRDTTDLSPSLVVAAAVESVAENITDGLTAPLLYFGLFGLPGAWAYRFANTCDSMLGYRDEHREWGGKFAARLDDLLNWIPARVTGLLIMFSARMVGENASNAWSVMLNQHNRTASPNAGWSIAAMAGALSVTLEKVGHYRLEGGTTALDEGVLRRAVRLTRWAFALAVIFTLLLMTILTALFGRVYIFTMFL